MKNLAFCVLVFLAILASCNKDVDITDDDDNVVDSLDQLELVVDTVFSLEIAEPSDICSYLDNHLLVVDDQTNMVYEITKEGEVFRVFNFEGEDLEGVWFDNINNHIYLAEERKRSIVKLDTAGNFIHEYFIDFTGTDENSGFEGLSFDAQKGLFAILNEKQPGKLLLYSIDLNAVNSSFDLGFASDYSAIQVEDGSSYYWILSDQSQTLNLVEKQGLTVKKDFTLGYDKAEGVYFDKVNRKVYIVRDTQEPDKLYVYNLKN